MSLVDELSPRRGRDAERTLGGSFSGVATGIVSNNQDPDGLGRVKVRMPWLSEASESDWAPVITWMGGSRTGAVSIPEPDDLVLLGFEHGDLNHPYVLGIIRTSHEPPDYDNEDGGNHTRSIRSRSGHELRFVDGAEENGEKIVLSTQGGHQITLDDSQGSTRVTLKTAGGNEIVIDDEGASSGIRIKDSSGNELQFGSEGAVLKAATRLSIQAPAIEVHADATLTLNGSTVRLN